MGKKIFATENGIPITKFYFSMPEIKKALQRYIDGFEVNGKLISFNIKGNKVTYTYKTPDGYSAERKLLIIDIPKVSKK